MADKYSKSKLKRKKSTVVEHQADIYQRGSLQKISIPFNSPHVTEDVKTDSSKTSRTVSPTLTWWTRNDPNSSEKLWAQTIQTVLPLLGSELWDPLPEPSTATPWQSESQPPCPANEVPPFPEPSRPPGSPLQSPPPPPRVTSPSQPTEPPPRAGPPGTPPHGGGGGPQAPAASRSVCPLRTTEDSRPPVTQRELGAGQGSAGEKTRRSQDLAERSTRPYPLWRGPAPKEAPPGRPSTTDTQRVQTMRRLQGAEVEEARPPGAEGEGGPKETELGGGEERLQCCPMCTQVFPSRFSQMDCDSHLARCLSEMNVDTAW